MALYEFLTTRLYGTADYNQTEIH